MVPSVTTKIRPSFVIIGFPTGKNELGTNVESIISTNSGEMWLAGLNAFSSAWLSGIVNVSKLLFSLPFITDKCLP